MVISVERNSRSGRSVPTHARVSSTAAQTVEAGAAPGRLLVSFCAMASSATCLRTRARQSRRARAGAGNGVERTASCGLARSARSREPRRAVHPAWRVARRPGSASTPPAPHGRQRDGGAARLTSSFRNLSSSWNHNFSLSFSPAHAHTRTRRHSVSSRFRGPRACSASRTRLALRSKARQRLPAAGRSARYAPLPASWPSSPCRSAAPRADSPPQRCC
jgi:hypothetical protein